MKTDAQIDAIMAAIPEQWRARWCSSRLCACLGCVQTGNKAVIAQKITGEEYRGDPEYISEAKLREHGAVYEDHKLSREEWDSWMKRQSVPRTTPSTK